MLIDQLIHYISDSISVGCDGTVLTSQFVILDGVGSFNMFVCATCALPVLGNRTVEFVLQKLNFVRWKFVKEP